MQPIKGPWFVRMYADGDEYGIAKLMELGFGIDEDHSRRLWMWKCKKNPNGYITLVAERKGLIVGHISLTHVRMKLGNKTVIGSLVADVIVHPSFRRQGIFGALRQSAISEARREGISILYVNPTKQSYPGFVRHGWFDVCNVPHFIKFLNVYDALTQYVSNKYKIMKSATENQVSRFIVQFLLRVVSVFIDSTLVIFGRDDENFDLEDIQVAKIVRFDDRLDDFWKDVSKHYQIIVVRDSSYLNWRYFERPGSKHTVLLAERDGNILGYIVLLITDSESGNIVDMITYPDKSIIQALLSKAIEYFKGKKVNWITCNMLANNLFYRMLREKGFIPVPSKSPLLVYINSLEFSEAFVKNAENWHITYGP